MKLYKLLVLFCLFFFPMHHSLFGQDNTSQGVTVLYFHATWCGPCQAMEANDAEALKKINAKHIDADKSPDLVKKYGIQALPTVIYLKDGVPVKTVSGAVSNDVLLQNFHNATQSVPSPKKPAKSGSSKPAIAPTSSEAKTNLAPTFKSPSAIPAPEYKAAPKTPTSTEQPHLKTELKKGLQKESSPASAKPSSAMQHENTKKPEPLHNIAPEKQKTKQ